MRIIAKRKHLKMAPGGEYTVTSVEARALIALGIARKAPPTSVVASRSVATKTADAPKRTYTRRDMTAEPSVQPMPAADRSALFTTPKKDGKA